MAFKSQELSATRRQWKPTEVKKNVNKNFAPIAEEREEDLLSDKTPTSIKNSKKSVPNKTTGKKDETSKPLLKTKILLEKNKQLKSSETEKSNTVTESAAFRKEVVADLLNNVKKELETMQNVSKPKLSGWPKSVSERVEDDESKKTTGKYKLFDRTKVGHVIQNIIDRVKTTTETKTETDEKKTEIKTKTSEGSTEKTKNNKLNMKEFVNLYKSLSYGSKDDIKNTLENLPIKNQEGIIDEEKIPQLKLKELERKIKKIDKKQKKIDKGDVVTSLKPKLGKKKIKKFESQRNKVIKVPATLDYSFSPVKPNTVTDKEVVLNRRKKKEDDREPWKYVGNKSVLDEKYIVYPPPKRTNRKKTVKKKVKIEGQQDQKKVTCHRSAPNFVEKNKQISLSNLNSYHNSLGKISATSVCDLKFRPVDDNDVFTYPDVSSNPFLLYLHNKNMINVQSPYKNKQFARVKLFRNCGLDDRVPLIRRNPQIRDNTNKISVQSLQIPEDKEKQFNELFDFKDDIENINEFLLSQGHGRSNQQVTVPHKPQPLPERFKLRNSRLQQTTIQPIQDSTTLAQKQTLISNFFKNLGSKNNFNSSKCSDFGNWQSNLQLALCY